MHPTVWFNKSFSPVLHSIRALSGAARVLASHTHPDSPTLLVADEAFLEPAGLTGEAYVRFCLDVCRERGVTVFWPQKEARSIVARRADFEAIGVLLIVAAGPDVLRHLDEKDRFTAHFPREICPVPETVPVRTWPAFETATRALRTRHAGVCFKPARGVYGHGFRILTVQEDLDAFLGGDQLHMTMNQARALFTSSPEATFPTMLVMQHLGGVERSVDAVAWNGELAAATVRCKVGGLGNVQLLEDRPDLVEATRRLARHFGLSGVFNAQFKDDDAGVPHMLEINPRPSGGLYLSLASGTNYPLVALNLALGRLRPEDVPPPATGLRVTEVKQALVLDGAPLTERAEVVA